LWPHGLSSPEETYLFLTISISLFEVLFRRCIIHLPLELTPQWPLKAFTRCLLDLIHQMKRFFSVKDFIRCTSGDREYYELTASSFTHFICVEHFHMWSHWLLGGHCYSQWYSDGEKSWDSSVVIVTDYRLDDWMIEVQIPVGAGNFSFWHCVQTGSGAHPASYPMGTRGSFHGG
jgi:hypothetical protein